MSVANITGLLVQLPVITVIATWVGIVLSFYTVQSFNLRNWQIAAYYFFTGLVVFMIYSFINSFHLFFTQTELLIYAEYGLKIISLVFITVGVYKVRNTAKMLGV